MALRSRSSPRRPLWIIVLIAFVCAVAIGAYLYTPRHYTACYLVPSEACNTQPPPEPVRVYTDDEIAARAIMRDIVRARPVQSKNPKIAFMFLTPSTLPFEKLWEKFFMVRFLLYFQIAVNTCLGSKGALTELTKTSMLVVSLCNTDIFSKQERKSLCILYFANELNLTYYLI